MKTSLSLEGEGGTSYPRPNKTESLISDWPWVRQDQISTISSPAPILWAGARLFSYKFLMSLNPRDYLKPGPEHRAAYGDLIQGRARDSSHASSSLPGSLQLWGARRQTLLESRHMQPLTAPFPCFISQSYPCCCQADNYIYSKAELVSFCSVLETGSLDTALAVLELSI